MDKIEIIFAPTKEKPFVVINKPKGLPSAPLTEDDNDNALSQAGELYPEIFNVHGRKEIEYGLLHRLDTATDGLLVIATTQECYDFLINEQKEGRFVKYYSALCYVDNNINEQKEGFPICDINLKEITNGKEYEVASFFRGFGKKSSEVRPVTMASGKAALKKLGKPKTYTTNVFVKELKENKALVECEIKEGYRHQVRCHLSWIGLPIVNDSTYGILDKKNVGNAMKFSATKIKFYYPSGELNSYEIDFSWS